MTTSHRTKLMITKLSPFLYSDNDDVSSAVGDVRHFLFIIQARSVYSRGVSGSLRHPDTVVRHSEKSILRKSGVVLASLS